MFEKKLEAGRHILTGKPIPLMRDGEEISGGYARWARAGRHSSSRPEGLFVYSGHCVGNGYGLLDGVRIYCRRHNWRRSVKMEEQKLIQMIRFDHDLVVFIEGSELLTPDEVRGLDNRYAILFIRGARPVMDLKYELTQHPAIRHTVDGGGPPYIHKGKQAPAFTGTPLFQAFSAEELNESEENAA